MTQTWFKFKILPKQKIQHNIVRPVQVSKLYNVKATCPARKFYLSQTAGQNFFQPLLFRGKKG